jgi:surface antigen
MAKKGKNTYSMYHCNKKTARSMGSAGGNISTGHVGDQRKLRGDNL